MGRRPSVRLTSERPALDIISFGCVVPSRPLTPAEVQQIRRTVSRAPEVMVKVTGGGTEEGAVAAHFGYISRGGKLAIETDDGTRVADRDSQKMLVKDWHLGLTAGLYRAPRDGRTTARKPKLVHKIVLSMPSPTPPDKVLAAARKFAREKFGERQHRYALVLHTDQQNPHVHLVVKAENEDGRRLHIDKEMLRHWREDFAQLMREQGVAANATSRVVRGRNKRKMPDPIYRAKRRGASTMVNRRIAEVARADALDIQGEAVLAGEVRHFARHLPRVRTDREHIAAAIVDYTQKRTARESTREHPREKTTDRTR